MAIFLRVCILFYYAEMKENLRREMQGREKVQCAVVCVCVCVMQSVRFWTV